jgi:pyruvate-formate lyase-activating enzyme
VDEGASLLIRTTRGCPWNRCEFCVNYKDMKFSLRSARTDVNPPKGFVPLGEIRAVAYDMEWAAKNNAAFIKKWQDIIVRVK